MPDGMHSWVWCCRSKSGRYFASFCVIWGLSIFLIMYRAYSWLDNDEKGKRQRVLV